MIESKRKFGNYTVTISPNYRILIESKSGLTNHGSVYVNSLIKYKQFYLNTTICEAFRPQIFGMDNGMGLTDSVINWINKKLLNINIGN